ncbi:hypothetical protein EKO27_g2667 [Xylaria grammica]|uniref:Wax synthase domain-containing protein n=1 Tax=Xylaria grammica TaxID=363999 RepID=A0A439DDD1_9PEZI|nr:hypothetical protein EKO27_g2667 [Xylaria grammica]
MPSQQPLPDLASVYRELYRAKFRADVRDATTTPFVVPFHLLAYWVVPTLYLAIPHNKRPWLYHARWLVLAFVCAFDWYMVRHVKSMNFASSYGVGLLCAWTTIWIFALLIWTRPQRDARRVERRKIIRRVDEVGTGQGADRLPTLPHDRPLFNPDTDRPNGLSSALIGDDKVKFSTKIRRVQGNGDGPANGVGKGEAHANLESIGDEIEEALLVRGIVALNDSNGNPPLDRNTALEIYRLTREQGYEYYWQEYPADASFWTRLDWAFDIVSSFRLTGWNWAPSCLPPYKPPPRIGEYQLPLEYGLHRSKQGYERSLSRGKLIVFRWLFNFAPSYIIIDLCATLMTTDPYFIVGPEHNYPLPTHLVSLHPVLLSLQRTMIAFIAILFALQYAFNFGAILLALYCPLIIGFRAHPWHLPSLTGSFMQVLDRGLSGFWGSWWHQTFRTGFSAPTKWLVRHGYLPPSRKSGDGGIAMTTPLLQLSASDTLLGPAFVLRPFGPGDDIAICVFVPPPSQNQNVA